MSAFFLSALFSLAVAQPDLRAAQCDSEITTEREILFGITALTLLRPADFSISDAEQLKHFGFPDPADISTHSPAFLVDLYGRCLPLATDNPLLRYIVTKKQWANIILAEALQDLWLEQCCPPPNKDPYNSIALLLHRRPTNILTEFRKTSRAVLACIEDRRKHYFNKPKPKSVMKNQLAWVNSWVQRLTSNYTKPRIYRYQVEQVHLLPPNTGFSEPFGNQIILALGGPESNNIFNSILLHESLHQPFWDAFHQSNLLATALTNSSCVFSWQAKNTDSLLGYETWVSLFIESLIRSLTRQINGEFANRTWRIEVLIDSFLKQHWANIEQGSEFIPQLLDDLRKSVCLKREGSYVE